MRNRPQMHEYSGGRRGGAVVGRKTVRLTIGRKGSGSVAAETKTVTIALATAANIQFAYHTSYPGQEIIPVKSQYDKGETVKVHLALANVGDKASRGTVVVKDLDTGSRVTSFERPTWPNTISPGVKWSSATAVPIGPMPARNWRLEFTVTP